MGRVFKPQRKRSDGTAWTSKRWWIQYSDENGTKRSKAASTDKAISQSMLRKAEERVERIRLGLESPASADMALKDLAERYLKDMELHLKPRSVESYRLSLEILVLGTKDKKPELRIKKVSEVTPVVIKDYQARSSKTLSSRTINKNVTVFGSMLNWAVDNQLLRVNPIKGLRMLPNRPTRNQRALTDEEIQELLIAADSETREIWILFLETGMRKREVALLAWKDVAFQRNEITVRADVAKSKKARRIPMSKSVRQILLDRKAQAGSPKPDDLVVPKIRNRGFYDYVLRCFDRDVEDAGIEKDGVHIHALRRTFATRLIRSGADPKTVQTLLGHSTLELTLKLYTDAQAMDLKGAIERLPGLEVREANIRYFSGPYAAAS